ncbi:MAG: four helix bundle protein [Bacteroidetes bacterium]|jgi:four helix bundle protein|nr:four helix bundle protein [Bacteroidota bacterium]
MTHSNSKVEYVKAIKLRCKSLAIDVLKLCDTLQSNRNSYKVILFQLCKSASSTAANYNAACRARSKKEFFSKLSIVVEEADETVFWLEVLHDGNFTHINEEISALLKEATEILVIFATARKKMSQR